MKYSPKLLTENHNVSPTHPLVELAWLSGALLLFVSLVVFSLGAFTDYWVSKTSIQSEQWLSRSAMVHFKAEPDPPLRLRLKRLLATQPKDSVLHQYHFQVFRVADEKTVNAMALPGGNILVFQGLLDKVESENELAMVLAHELGHYQGRDHLRGLGRGLSLALASAWLFGGDSGITALISTSLLTVQASYSQQQESQADQFALQVLVQRYGHAGGATDFFKRFSDESQLSIDFLASHPQAKERIHTLEQAIQKAHFHRGATTPLGTDLSKAQQ